MPDSIKLIAGRTGQEFNHRKARKGTYREGRYHATAVENGDHLIKCIVYIDFNMVRAGVVKHPGESLRHCRNMTFHELNQKGRGQS